MRTEVINLLVNGMTDVEASSEVIPTYIPEGGEARGHLPTTKYYVKCSIYLSISFNAYNNPMKSMLYISL